ncbi:MAG: hypothetical protein LBC18_08310, partial [Opitutaceae bacterium]|nr:hypothetical protein [Opitutaceae bacterium]
KEPGAIGRLPVFWPDAGAVRDDLLDYAFEIEHWDAQLARTRDPRLEGRGAEFDAFPYASRARGLYGRVVEKHERIPTPWAGDGDREAPGFDPERPGAR